MASAYVETVYQVDGEGNLVLDDNEQPIPTGETINRPAVFQTWVNLHPEYDYEITDQTALVEAEEAAKAARKADRQKIKGFIQNIKDSDLPNWHKKILKTLVRELRD